jgi:hypothetical protein
VVPTQEYASSGYGLDQATAVCQATALTAAGTRLGGVSGAWATEASWATTRVRTVPSPSSQARGRWCQVQGDMLGFCAPGAGAA